MTQFALRFDRDTIGYWAKRYRTNQSEDTIEQIIAPRVRAAGYFTRPDFLELCEWKSPRIRKHCAKNSESFIWQYSKEHQLASSVSRVATEEGEESK